MERVRHPRELGIEAIRDTFADLLSAVVKPLLFLDVDRVINDREAFMMLRVLRRDAPGRQAQLGVEMVGSGICQTAVPLHARADPADHRWTHVP